MGSQISQLISGRTGCYISPILVLHDIVTGSVMKCWQHFVLACRKLVTRTVSTDNVKLGDALLLQFYRRTEQLFGKESVTPNMHLHCHLADCMTDYGPLHSFWCYTFERCNGILGSLPNNNHSIENQLMNRFLSENHGLSYLPPSEFPENFLPVFPKMQLGTGSILDTLLPSISDNYETNKWTLDSLQSLELPRFSYRCALNEENKEDLVNLYCSIYSVPVTEENISYTCLSYDHIVLNGKLYGTCNSRTASSSIVIANWVTEILPCSSPLSLRAARIEKFYKHSVDIGEENKTHLLCLLSWFKPYPQTITKPISVWYFDLFDHSSLVPVQVLQSRTISFKEKFNDELVLFVCSCLR